MYAKLFTSIYQGTLRGNSHGLLVFTNLIAHADHMGEVDMHPRAIAEEVGLSVDQVRDALAMLEAPDNESRSPECEGRRIVRLDEHRAWGWRIVNHLKYRAIKSEDDRREQNRIAQERWREKNKQVSKTVITHKPASAQSAHTDTDTEAEALKEKKTRKRASPPVVAPELLVAAGFTAELAADFIAHKHAKKAPLTERAWADHCREAEKAEWSAVAAAEKVMAKSWRGFESRYVDEQRATGHYGKPDIGTTVAHNPQVEATQRLLREQDDAAANATPPPAHILALRSRKPASEIA